jgi:hypothetical protein
VTESDISSICLRVFKGLHQGASVALASFDSRVELGASGSAQVVLRDAPGVAQLALQDGVWFWQEEGFSQALQSGTVWRWGTVVLGLARDQDDWPSVLPMTSFVRTAPRPAITSEPEPQDLPASSANSAVNDPTPEHSEHQIDNPSMQASLRGAVNLKQPRWTSKRVALALAGLILVMLLVLFLASTIMASRSAPPLQSATSSQRQPMDMALVQKVLLDLEVDAMVEPQLRSDGRLLLRGVVSDESQLEAVAGAFRKMSQHVNLMLITQSEFVSRVVTLQHNLPEGVFARAQPNGQLVLASANRPADWTLSDQLVKGELPEVVHLKHQVLSPIAMSQDVEPDTYTMNQTTPLRDAAFPAIPKIAAVIGGERPYLMLSQGQKWLPGGKMGGLTLVAIEEQNLVFEDPQNRQWRRPR